MSIYVSLVVNALSSCYNWARALFGGFGISLVAMFGAFIGITYTFNFFRGAIK